MQSAKSKGDNLFNEDPLKRAFQNRFSLGVDVDLTYLPKTQETVASFIQTVCAQWEDDITTLVELVRT
eukprot:6765969-Lingulodinium_polyedra.AAC.1